MIKILTIEDDVEYQGVLKRLILAGFPKCKVIPAMNGKEGFDLALKELPYIILLDIILPDLDGYMLCKKIKEDERIMHIPVIMITGVRPGSKVHVNALNAGADAFLAKPLDVPILKAQINSMLRIKKSEEKLLKQQLNLSRLVVERTTELESKLIEHDKSENDLRFTFEKLERIRIASLNLMEDLRNEIDTREKYETELKTNEEKFRTIFESVGSGLLYMKNNGIIIDVNPAFIELTGFSRKSLVGKNVVFLAKDVMKSTEIKNLMKVLYNTLKGKRVKNFNFEMNNRLLSASSFFNKEKNIIIGTIEDLTEQKAAEVARHELLVRQEAILGSIPDIIMEVSNDKIYTWANDAGYDYFGNDVLGKSAEYYFEGEQNVYEIVEPLFRGKEKPIYVESYQRRKDGEIRLLAWWCKTLKDIKGNVIGGLSSARDITDIKNKEIELQKSHEQLAALNLYLQRVREEERKIISRELHDDLGQSLTAVKIDIASLKLSIDDKKSLKIKIDKLSNLVSGSIDTVKRLTSQLRPHVLDDLGLTAAIEWYTSEFTERTGITINLNIDESIALISENELVIFRILQESLTNIARHSKASQTDISFTKVQNSIVLEVKDNGIGIKDKDMKSTKSFGLLNMRERAREIGGYLSITTIDQKGTLIILEIPGA